MWKAGVGRYMWKAGVGRYMWKAGVGRYMWKAGVGRREGIEVEARRMRQRRMSRLWQSCCMNPLKTKRICFI
jgi:hypothetical protein